MVKPPTFEVVAGTYEEFLLGYTFSSKENSLTQSFAAHDHAASVRCVAISGQYLASGGADDRIFIYDLKTRKQHFTLTNHNSTVNCLEFTDNHSHLISGSADGVLAIVRVGNWQLEKVWEKAHKGAAILDVAVHSSGKLALTLGADCSLCTWNLVKGRQAYVINLRSKCKDARSLEKILWAPDGVRFVLYGGKYTEVWSVESGGFLTQIGHKEKVTACLWMDDEMLLVGHENGEISVLNIEEGKVISSFQAHDSRVKSVGLFKKRIVSVSSNGEIKVWNRNHEELAVVDSGCRLTCVCIVPPIEVKTEENPEESVVEIELEPVETKKIKKAQVVEIVEDEDEDTPVKKKKTKQINEGQVPKKKKKKRLNPTRE
ncbi:hypothetical protein Zmor_008489 [Zophobas morio]|uniref:Anaphase-promoting complex subunit 4-like WD40 domain-containing protein n=1 Tax=Zophobas morio TaxID=2755281 RepID=A0AA38IVJ3_9CUCU|nr:hypothetical protein Zmor_008489 [Zophobas morio]